jgi:hypothetical protein
MRRSASRASHFIPDRPVMRAARARADRCHCRNKTSNLINIVSFQSRIISARFSRLFVK